MLENYFSEKELSCPCCGKNGFNEFTLLKFNRVRQDVGFPMIMSSGYRCPEYNKKRGFTQSHSTGQCGDIACDRLEALLIVQSALDKGFTGFGIKQKGNSRCIHLDDLPQDLNIGRPRPHIWSY